MHKTKVSEYSAITPIFEAKCAAHPVKVTGTPSHAHLSPYWGSEDGGEQDGR